MNRAILSGVAVALVVFVLGVASAAAQEGAEGFGGTYGYTYVANGQNAEGEPWSVKRGGRMVVTDLGDKVAISTTVRTSVMDVPLNKTFPKQQVSATEIRVPVSASIGVASGSGEAVFSVRNGKWVLRGSGSGSALIGGDGSATVTGVQRLNAAGQAPRPAGVPAALVPVSEAVRPVSTIDAPVAVDPEVMALAFFILALSIAVELIMDVIVGAA